jgi:hypothetical protein
VNPGRPARLLDDRKLETPEAELPEMVVESKKGTLRSAYRPHGKALPVLPDNVFGGWRRLQLHVHRRGFFQDGVGSGDSGSPIRRNRSA